MTLRSSINSVINHVIKKLEIKLKRFPCLTRPPLHHEAGNIYKKNELLFLIPLPIIAVYSETIWAVGIAQLTHHKIRGGGKNSEAGGRRIFAPTVYGVVS